MVEQMLQLIEINKTYQQPGSEPLTVLSGASLAIKPGEIVSLVGPSGSGKTTLLQIAGLLDRPNSGKVMIDGERCCRLEELEQNEIRKHKIGFIYQFHHLLPEFTVLENIMLPRMIAGVARKEAEAQAKVLLEELDILNKKDSMPSELSGGQQQRAAIARALVSHPKLVLADEPTGNLDVKNAKIVFDLLLKQTREKKLATLIVTHNMELAEQTDKIISIKDKKLVVRK
jgi:lipoprotein-releasing system ATP-binding protein